MIAPLFLLSSCALLMGEPDDTSVEGDADTDSDTDADSDADADVTFDIVLPMSGATVTVDDKPVTCDASNVCVATVEGDGTFEIAVSHPTLTFVPKEVTVTDGIPNAAEVTYAAGGCNSDASWNGTTWCDDWTMSEFGTTVEGRYYDEDYPDDEYDVTTYGYDVNHDEILDALLDMEISIGGAFNISGNLLGGFSDGQVYGYGYVEDDLSAIHIALDNGNTELFQKNFVRVSN